MIVHGAGRRCASARRSSTATSPSRSTQKSVSPDTAMLSTGSVFIVMSQTSPSGSSASWPMPVELPRWSDVPWVAIALISSERWPTSPSLHHISSPS